MPAAVADLAAVQNWLYDSLVADSTINTATGGRVFANAAPSTTAFPLVTFAFVGGVDVIRTVGDTRVTQALYLVRAIGKGNSLAGIKPIAARFDTVLTVPYGGVTVDGVRIRSCVHDQPHVRFDQEYDVPATYLGAVYRIYFYPEVQ
jgi:hypothetical protein